MPVVAKRKSKIPSSLRQAVWDTYVGNQFDAKCTVGWCQARITPFTFEVGHNVPESRGGCDRDCQLETVVSPMQPIHGEPIHNR